jgi:hypothetical protein
MRLRPRRQISANEALAPCGVMPRSAEVGTVGRGASISVWLCASMASENESLPLNLPLAASERAKLGAGHYAKRQFTWAS